jgi:hypothetical protein
MSFAFGGAILFRRVACLSRSSSYQADFNGYVVPSSIPVKFADQLLA